jgi:hypothetical protein
VEDGSCNGEWCVPWGRCPDFFPEKIIGKCADAEGGVGWNGVYRERRLPAA